MVSCIVLLHSDYMPLSYFDIALQKVNCLISMITKGPHVCTFQSSMKSKQSFFSDQAAYLPTEHLTFSVPISNSDTQERAQDPTTAHPK